MAKQFPFISSSTTKEGDDEEGDGIYVDDYQVFAHVLLYID